MQELAGSGLRIWEFPKIRGTLLGVPIIRTIVFGGLYWGPLILGNYHLGLGLEGLFWVQRPDFVRKVRARATLFRVLVFGDENCMWAGT